MRKRHVVQSGRRGAGRQNVLVIQSRREAACANSFASHESLTGKRRLTGSNWIDFVKFGDMGETTPVGQTFRLSENLSWQWKATRSLAIH